MKGIVKGIILIIIGVMLSGCSTLVRDKQKKIYKERVSELLPQEDRRGIAFSFGGNYYISGLLEDDVLIKVEPADLPHNAKVTFVKEKSLDKYIDIMTIPVEYRVSDLGSRGFSLDEEVDDNVMYSENDGRYLIFYYRRREIARVFLSSIRGKGAKTISTTMMYGLYPITAVLDAPVYAIGAIYGVVTGVAVGAYYGVSSIAILPEYVVDPPKYEEGIKEEEKN